MNIKNIKTKHLIALALTLFMVVPMLFVAIPGVRAASGPVVSIVPTGQLGAAAGSTTNIAVQTVGQTVVVDVRVDGVTGVSNDGGTHFGVDGFATYIEWNPAVLTFSTYSEVNWLPDQSTTDITAHTSTGTLQLNQIAEDTGNPWATFDSSTGAVAATITFTVASAGSTAISVVPEHGVALLSAPESIGGLVQGADVANVGSANALYNPQTTISLLASPQDTTNQVTFTSNPIGQTFSLDIFINNPLQVNIWAWNLGVTWNAAAVQLTSITEGSYMGPTGATGTSGANTIFVPGYIDNTAGDIPQGISDVYTSVTTTNAQSGVLATLTFTVINYASSNIQLTQGIPSLETITAGNPPVSSALTAPLLNGAVYTSPAPPAPTSPVAKITNTGTSTTYTNGQALTPPISENTPATFDLTAANSVAGNDVVPQPSEATNPVTGYSWTITANVAGAPALITNPTTTETLSFTTPSTGISSLTTYTIQLVVTAPQVATPNDVNYNPQSAPVTFSIQVEPGSIAATTAGALIDVYVVNPTTPSTTNPSYSPDGTNGNPLAAGTSAYTPNAYSDAFGPQAMMNLAALVTYNGAPVANKEVTFEITSNTEANIGTLSAMTGDNGIATVSYALPWYAGTYQTGPVSEFGVWSVTGSVEVQQTIVTDNMPFDFGDIISITNVQVALPTAPRSTSAITTTNGVTVTLAGISDQAQNYWMTYTVTDAGNVPVAQGLVSGTMAAATYTDTTGTLTVNPSTGTQAASFAIPSYAFVGTATVNINIFNANPVTSQSTAVSYCPQATATFTIEIPYGE